MNRGEPVAYIWRNPFRVVKTRRFQPRVASVLAGLANTRQPWALRRNPFGIRGLRFMVTMHMRSERRLSTIVLSQRRRRPIFVSLVVVLVCPRTGTLEYTKWVYGVHPIAVWGACEKFHKSLAAQNFGC